MKQSALTIILLLWGSVAFAEEPKLADKTPGLAVGKKAPEFELKDQYGKTHTLKSLSKDKKVALVFYRSGQW